MSEPIAVFMWWLVIQILGLAVWPLLTRWLRWLPDRGYLLAKPIGLLFVAYGVWLLATVGVVQNTTGGILIVLIGVAVLGCAIGARSLAAAESAPAPGPNRADEPRAVVADRQRDGPPRLAGGRPGRDAARALCHGLS